MDRLGIKRQSVGLEVLTVYKDNINNYWFSSFYCLVAHIWGIHGQDVRVSLPSQVLKPCSLL